MVDKSSLHINCLVNLLAHLIINEYMKGRIFAKIMSLWEKIQMRKSGGTLL